METPANSLPLAVISAVDVNNFVETSTANSLISYVGDYIPLTISWSTQLTTDEHNYWVDVMTSSSQDPAHAAKTAADYAKYMQDQSEMSTETGALSTLINSQKMAVSYETAHEKQAYNLVSSLTQYTQLYCMLLRLKK